MHVLDPSFSQKTWMVPKHTFDSCSACLGWCLDTHFALMLCMIWIHLFFQKQEWCPTILWTHDMHDLDPFFPHKRWMMTKHTLHNVMHNLQPSFLKKDWWCPNNTHCTHVMNDLEPSFLKKDGWYPNTHCTHVMHDLQPSFLKKDWWCPNNTHCTHIMHDLQPSFLKKDGWRPKNTHCTHVMHDLQPSFLKKDRWWPNTHCTHVIHNVATTFTSHRKLYTFAEPKPFSSVKPTYFDFSSANFIVQDHILSTAGSSYI